VLKGQTNFAQVRSQIYLLSPYFIATLLTD
jgi:hypothetical protein